MVRWIPSLLPFFLIYSVVYFIVWFPGLVYEVVKSGLLALVIVIAFVIGMFVLYTAMMKYHGDIVNHEVSRWRMPADEAARRLARAMAARGVRPPVERAGDRVTFDLPPLTIVVAPGQVWTRVMVGPSVDENELRVERLKAFVERVLG